MFPHLHRMVRSTLPLLTAAILLGCTAEPPAPSPPNRWADERLLPVLEAQEHRDTEALCALLQDTSSVVREASALAFASVQGTAGIPCLLGVLNDPSVPVRATAVWALGFVADSAAVLRLAQHAQYETDTTVQRAFLNTSFLAMQRNGIVKEPAAAMYFMERNTGHEAVRAADALRRMVPAVLIGDTALLFQAAVAQWPPEVEMMLVQALAKVPGMESERLLWEAMHPARPWEVRVEAMRALERARPGLPEDSLMRWCDDAEPQVAFTADGLLADRRPLSLEYLHRWANQHAGSFGIPANQQPAPDEATLAGQLSMRLESPYAEAARIRLLAAIKDGIPDDEMEALLFGDGAAVVRQAAFSALSARVSERMRMPRAIYSDRQLREAAPFWHRVFRTLDAGLISAAAEALQTASPHELQVLFPETVQQQATAPLHPIRDLEALQLLHGLAAKRDGLPPPAHTPIPFNHPIDPIKLRTLPQGQRYRIVTGKGDIIITTDVDECPGSSLAFDSLVTAGYYNGKAFHRMVPNFVVQGGCPRGDGYGGMPWTLRTEIGRKPFTAGSVGLASAGRDTESCQFFITHSATPHLDGRYTRFGEVMSGMDVVWQLQVGDVMERVERIE